MRRIFPLLSVFFLEACSLISPYSITFTNSASEVIDPSISTLDFVVSQPTLAYISGVSCEGAKPLDILPVQNPNMEVTTVHNLPLTLMKDQPAGARCEVTVTAYDKTTTETSSATIELMMKGIPLAKEGEMCAGIAAIQCAEGLTCEMPIDTTTTDASGTCVMLENENATERTIDEDVETTSFTDLETTPASTLQEVEDVAIEDPVVETEVSSEVTTASETTTPQNQ